MNRIRLLARLSHCAVLWAALGTDGAIFDSPSNRAAGQRILAETPQLQSTGFIKSVVSDDIAGAVLIAPNAVLTVAHAEIRTSILEDLRFGLGSNYQTDTGPMVRIKEVFHLSTAPVDFSAERDFTVAILEESIAGPHGTCPDAEIAVLSRHDTTNGDAVAVVGYGSLDAEFEVRDGGRDLYSDIVVPSPFFLLAGEYFTTRVLDPNAPENGIPVGQATLGSSGGGAYWKNDDAWELVGITSGTTGSTTHYAEITPSTRSWIEGILATNPPPGSTPLRIDNIESDNSGNLYIRFPASSDYAYDLLHSENLIEWEIAATTTFTASEGIFVWNRNAVEAHKSFFKILRHQSR